MNFVQSEFLWFMATVFVAYWALGRAPHGRWWQNGLLAVASATFYGWVHPWFLTLLYFSAVLDFFVAQQIERQRAYRDYWLMLSLAGNLGVLAYFKYFNFFIGNVVGAVRSVSVVTAHLTTLAILLPVGRVVLHFSDPVVHH